MTMEVLVLNALSLTLPTLPKLPVLPDLPTLPNLPNLPNPLAQEHASAAPSSVAWNALTPHLPRLASSGPGFAVVPDFLSPDDVRLLKEDFNALKAEGAFKVAGVGDSSTNRVADEVRKCEQSFLFPRVKYGAGGHPGARSFLYDTIDGLRDACTRGTGEPLDAILTEGLYAAYPNGGYYRRHVDSYANTPQALRKFSFLLYCNEGWEESDGGCLRIHTDGGGEVAPIGVEPSYVDVQPKAGTLVLFRSDVPHEVLNTAAQRLAVVGWLNAPPEGQSERRGLIMKLGAAFVVLSGVKTMVAGLLGGGAKGN